MARKKAAPAESVETGFPETSMEEQVLFHNEEDLEQPQNENPGSDSFDGGVFGTEDTPALEESVEEDATSPEQEPAAEASSPDEAPEEQVPENTAGMEETPDPFESDGAFPDGETSPFSAAEDDEPFEATEPKDSEPEYDELLNEWSTGRHTSEAGELPEEEPLVLGPVSGEEEAMPEALFQTPDTPEENAGAGTARRTRRSAGTDTDPRRDRVLTIEARDEVQTEEEREAILWHEIQNAHWTRRILTGTLDGVEQTESGLTVAVVNYKGFRVAIPVKEMMLFSGKVPSGPEFRELMSRMRAILTARLGSEIDFVVKGHENKTRSVVASRRDAMLRKRQSFYLDTNELGQPLIHEGRVVQARVVAVAEKVIRVEVFGVECAIAARGLSRAWVGSASDHYCVGDRILVRVLKVSGTNPEDLSVAVDVRSVSNASPQEDLKKCAVQGRYAGRVTDIRGGVVFVRLNNGVNAIAHSCYDRRTPGKRDDVSFSVTRLDTEQGVAVGIITRIIKQNL